MNLFRLIALALLVWIGWFMIRNYLAKQRRQPELKKKRISARIVKCRQCELHLPESDAVSEGDDWFCSPAHRQTWLAHH
jgi:uncharacterized protein